MLSCDKRLYPHKNKHSASCKHGDLRIKFSQSSAGKITCKTHYKSHSADHRNSRQKLRQSIDLRGGRQGNTDSKGVNARRNGKKHK